MLSQLDLLQIEGSTLRDLGFDCPPRTRYQPYARLLSDPTGGGKRVRRGFPRAWWTFEILEVPLYEIFMDLLAGEESTEVYFTTLGETQTTSEGTVGLYTEFSALMRIAEKTWSTNERWENVVVEFTRLQEVT